MKPRNTKRGIRPAHAVLERGLRRAEKQRRNRQIFREAKANGLINPKGQEAKTISLRALTFGGFTKDHLKYKAQRMRGALT